MKPILALRLTLILAAAGAAPVQAESPPPGLDASSIFDQLQPRPTGDPHLRTWNIRGDDWVAGVLAYPTVDPQHLLVNTSVSLAGYGGGTHYRSTWKPVGHTPVPRDTVDLSRDGSRAITGMRDYGHGSVALVDTASGETLFAAPSAVFSTSGSAIWPWLSADGSSAVFTLWYGSAPLAPGGLVGPVDGVVRWDEGSPGLRPLGAPGAAVRGASADLAVLVLREPSGRVVALDGDGGLLHELCAVRTSGEETCAFRGLSPDGRYAAVLDEGVVPHRWGLIDLSTGVEAPLPPRGERSSWVAFDQDSSRMLYARAGEHHPELVVRQMADGKEFVLDAGPYHHVDRPLGFVAGHYAVIGSWDVTFIDTDVISADGFDAYSWQ